jgi:hypothetical protein
MARIAVRVGFQAKVGEGCIRMVSKIHVLSTVGGQQLSERRGVGFNTTFGLVECGDDLGCHFRRYYVGAD